MSTTSAGPRRRLDHDTVVRVAADLADELGLSRVTLARVAAALGVRSPSLYGHVEGLEGLRRGIARVAAIEVGDLLARATAGRAGDDALIALADAYRAFAIAHPGRYAATQVAPDRDDPALSAASDDAIEIVIAVLRGYGLAGDDAIHATRALRSALHGFVALETGGGFGLPLDLDESYRRLVATLAAGFREAALSSTPGTT